MKKIAVFLLTSILCFSLLLPINSFAEDPPAADPPAADEGALPPEQAPQEPPTIQEETQTSVPAPVLTEVSFSGAVLESAFSSEIFEYKLAITDQSSNIRLASYKCPDYNAMVQVYYLTNTSGDAIGLVVRLSNDSGANEYKFLFNTIKEIKKTPDASLMSLTFDYGELSPKFNAEIYKYTLYLPKDLEVLNIRAVTSDENAKIGTPSQITLNQNQQSSISVKITSSDGTNTLTYKLNIKRVNKTIAQIKSEMEDPNFESFVEIPFYETAPFYIGLGVILFLIALALVLYFTLRKKKNPMSSAVEPPADPGLLPNPCAEKEEATPDSVETPALPIKQTDAPAPQPNLEKQEEAHPASNEKAPVAPGETAAEEPADLNPQHTEAEQTPELHQRDEDVPAADTAPPAKKKKHQFFTGRKKDAAPVQTSEPAIPVKKETPPTGTTPSLTQEQEKQNPAASEATDPDCEIGTKTKRSKKEKLQKLPDREKKEDSPADDWLDLDKYKKYK